MGRKRARRHPSRSTSDRSITTEYVNVRPRDPHTSIEAPSDPRRYRALAERQREILAETRHPHYRYRHLKDMPSFSRYVGKATSREDLPFYLTRLEEIIEKQDKAVWVLAVESRFLDETELQISQYVAAFIKRQVGPFYKSLGLSATHGPNSTYELVKELYKLSFDYDRKPKRKLQRFAFPVRDVDEPLHDYLASARRWIRKFILPGDVSPEAIQFVASHLWEQGFAKFSGLRITMEDAYSKASANFQTQSDVFIWFRQSFEVTNEDTVP